MHLKLGTEGNEDRVPFYTIADFVSGHLSFQDRGFFVGNVQGFDAILGLPFIEDAKILVGNGRVSCFSPPPSVSIPDSDLGALGGADLAALGYTERPMTEDEASRFAQVSVIHNEFLTIEEEPRNPLLDVVDDPLLPDLSEEEARVEAEALLVEFGDVLCDELPGVLPPFRPVNHHIALVDPSIKTRPRTYPMPNKYSRQWAAHRELYVSSGRWSPAALDSACAMFAIPKKDPGEARFVVNLKPRNANTVKMHTPLPDMRSVRADVASAPFRSQVDFKAAFEQVRVAVEDVSKTGFTTPSGTFISRIMQMGDCNAPDTMNRVTYMMFRHYLGRFLAVFFDDAHVYSHSRRAHLRHLRIVFTTLRHYLFYLGRDKVQLFAKKLLSLGAVISDDGVEVDPRKWDKVRDWPEPRNVKDVLRFVGTVNWMGDHLPGVSQLLAPITDLTGKRAFVWGPEQQYAFTAVKAMVPHALSPIEWDKVETGEHTLFVTTDASIHGIGAVLSAGPSRESARPFRFHSAKFNTAQRNYDTTNQELLAIVEACKTFEQHLIGYPFVVVCDHRPLQSYITQLPHLTRRHVRMAMELSRFDFRVEFLEGRKNVIADSMSRLYETEDAVVGEGDFVVEEDLDELFPDAPTLAASAEFLLFTARFAPDAAELLPRLRKAVQVDDRETIELLVNLQGNRVDEAATLAALSIFAPLVPSPSLPSALSAPIHASTPPIETSGEGEGLVDDDHDPLDLLTPLQPLTPLPSHVDVHRASFDLPKEFLDALPAALKADSQFAEVLAQPDVIKGFEVDEDGWVHHILGGERRLCIPRGSVLGEGKDGRKAATLREFVITAGHEVLAHAGTEITLSFLRRYFWWDKMAKDVTDFCRSCEPCARGKTTTRKPFGKIHPMPIPSRPWEETALDFITGLPAVIFKREMVDSILVVTCVFSKHVHLFPVSTSYSGRDIAQVYFDGVYKHHGAQRAITSDRDPKFNAGFWRALHELVGTSLRMSGSNHPETDGVSEQKVKVTSQALRILASDNAEMWPTLLSSVEFALNLGVAGATGLSAFEASTGWQPRPWPMEMGASSGVPAADGMVEAARLNALRASDSIIGARLSMAAQANKHRLPDPAEFTVGNRVYVDTKGLAFPASMTRKFLPRFLGPFPITAAFPASSNYEVALPPHFLVHNRFHASKLAPHFPNDEARFPARQFATPPLSSAADAAAQPWTIETILSDVLKYGRRRFLVRFLGYSPSEDRWLWETELRKRAPEALRDYLERRGGKLAQAGERKIMRTK